jgi:hypothetical protein
MDSSNAEKAWEAREALFTGAPPEARAFIAADKAGFIAGRASRDAEVAELTAMNEAIREVDGEEMTYRDEVLIPRLEGERDEALKALGEARARYGDLEARLAEAQAVIAKARKHLDIVFGENSVHMSAMRRILTVRGSGRPGPGGSSTGARRRGDQLA